ncbi:MAG: hypothetical protein ACR65R_04400 [Methylomicrobium sp.]
MKDTSLLWAAWFIILIPFFQAISGLFDLIFNFSHHLIVIEQLASIRSRYALGSFFNLASLLFKVFFERFIH